MPVCISAQPLPCHSCGKVSGPPAVLHYFGPLPVCMACACIALQHPERVAQIKAEQDVERGLIALALLAGMTRDDLDSRLLAHGLAKPRNAAGVAYLTHVIVTLGVKL